MAALRRIAMLLALLPALALGAQATPESLARAAKLGESWDIAAFSTILEAGDTAELERYLSGFRNAAMRRAHAEGKTKVAMPAQMEALVLRYYGDPRVGPVLRRLFDSGGVEYRTRELFDRMFADVRSKDRLAPRPAMAGLLSTRVTGIEPQLTELLRELRPGMPEADAVAQFLARRRYEPAVPVLARMLRDAFPGQTIVLIPSLLEIGTPESIRAVVLRLEMLGKQPSSPAVQSEILRILSGISKLPPDAPLDYAALRRALPAALDENGGRALIAILKERKPEGATDDLLALLADPKLYGPALEALIATDDPAVWRRARAEVERLSAEGKLDHGRYLYGSSRLDPLIAAPQKHYAEEKAQARTRELMAKRAALKPPADARALRETNPGAFLAVYVTYTEERERVLRGYEDLPAATGLETEIGNAYLDLGHVARFELKDPRRAMELYEAARRYRPDLATFAEADLLQFDLHDKAAALARDRELLAKAQGPLPVNDVEATIAKGAKTWLAHQVEYLAHGKTFTGPVRVDDCGLVALLMTYGMGMPSEIDPYGVARYSDLAGTGYMNARPAPQAKRDLATAAIQRLPASTFALMGTGNLVGVLPDAQAVLAHFRKHDPAGYATACYFALLERVAQAPRSSPGGAVLGEPLKSAAARYREMHGEALAKADPRYASPEKTWRLLLESLRKGDVATAMSCLTAGQQNKFRALFEGSTPEQLRAMADSFTGFSLTGGYGDGMREAAVTRGKRAGFVNFVDVAGEWKIDEM